MPGAPLTAEDLVRARRAQAARDLRAQRLGVAPAHLVAHPHPAVGRADERAQQEPVAVGGDRVGAHRRVAVGVEGADERALGRQRARGRGVGERRDGRARRRVAGPDRDRERALARGRDHLVERPGRLGAAAEALQPGEGQHDRVVVAGGEPAEPRVDVAPELEDLEVAPQRPELRGAAQRARPDPGAVGEVREPGRAAQRVPRVGPRRHRGDDDPVRELRGDVLGRVHGEVDVAAEQRRVDLAHPALLVAAGAVAVARRRDRHDLGTAERGGDLAGLRERERAAAGPEPHARRFSGRTSACGASVGGDSARV